MVMVSALYGNYIKLDYLAARVAHNILKVVGYAKSATPL